MPNIPLQLVNKLKKDDNLKLQFKCSFYSTSSGNSPHYVKIKPQGKI